MKSKIFLFTINIYFVMIVFFKFQNFFYQQKKKLLIKNQFYNKFNKLYNYVFFNKKYFVYIFIFIIRKINIINSIKKNFINFRKNKYIIELNYFKQR